MKIRTITTGVYLDSPKEIEKIELIAKTNHKVKSQFEEAGYEVQTTRISTNSWEEYFKGNAAPEIIKHVQDMEIYCKKLNVDFFNIGYAFTPEKIELIPEINKSTSIISCSAQIGDYESGINYKNTEIAADVIKRISQETENGYGNFRFCAWANCKEDIPFFPVSFHRGKESVFAIGLECGDLAMKAFSQADGMLEAESNLKEIFESELKKIEDIAEGISQELGIKYNGIDSSLAPSLAEEESIAFAYERLGFGTFGSHGTLAISAIITKVLKNLAVKTCGYSGLMLPVCEDFGLAKRANEEAYTTTNLLLYSAVCGCGLDTVPIPGDITVKQIEAILLDTATLAIRLNKPLAVRLFPVPGKKAGQMTSFNSPYLIDCKILRV